jgi:CRISPR-associated protein Cas2
MRNYLLISYDVADPVRWRKVHKIVRGYGNAVQLSVFLGQLSEKDEAVMIERLRDVIHHEQDQVVVIKLGRADGSGVSSPSNWKVLGKRYEAPDYSIMIY